MGVLDEYVCGVMFRIQCWLENQGIPYEVKPKIEKCIMHETGSCAGDFIIRLPASGNGADPTERSG